MKRFGLSALTGLFVLSLFVGSVSARPQYKKVVDDRYKASKIEAALEEVKCNLCHFGTSKKNRNDFGKALTEHLNKDLFDELKGDADKLNDAITKALDKAEAKANPNGEKYGERISKGELPGTIEEADEE
jgi:hypothetical protein